MDPTADLSEGQKQFLLTLDGLSREEALGNLRIDARLYGWSAESVRAMGDMVRRKFVEVLP